MLINDESDEKDLSQETEDNEEIGDEEQSEELNSKKTAKSDDTDEGDQDGSDKSDDDDISHYKREIQDRIKRLTAKQRDAERREAEALEYAKAVKAELDTIKKREATISKSFETEAEHRVSAQEQLLRNNLRVAVDTGDVDKQVEIQTELVRLATDRERLRNFKAYRQEAETAPQRQPDQQAQRQQQRPDPKAQAWANKNNWFGSDRIMTQAAYTIHEDLIAEGFNATGDDYYRELDNRIRREFPHKFQQSRKPATTVGAARPTQAKKGGRDIELTDTQKSIANKLGVSYDAYKRQLKLTMERAD